jgi:hypothetical protein
MVHGFSRTTMPHYTAVRRMAVPSAYTRQEERTVRVG